MEIDLKQTVEDNFKIYAGMVIQQRAICDVRDCIKPSARQLMYAQLIDKIDWKHKYQKSLKSVGSGTSHFYIHGDSSAYGTLIRMGKPFVLRYPLEDVNGNYGTIVNNGDEAASRYTEMRLHPLASYLFSDLEKDTITHWIDNYDSTEQYPSVLPSLGFYNIVNGTTGIGVALASSIPQFNLKDVNKALIYLLDNPDATFDEIYCAPDFATGGFLMNESEVKESLRTGNGKACKLRAAINYNEKDNCLYITEMPYSVYTSTICKQMADLLNDGKLPGVDTFIDLTKKTPNIKVKLTKTANPGKVCSLLFKNTSLQYHFGINMVMLENGTTPKVFGWKDALMAHLYHEKDVLRRSLQFDLNKFQAREHILDGLLIAIAHIEEVIAVIKNASDGTSAKTSLMNKFGFDEAQAKAILDIKLIRLANLEGVKIQKERDEVQANIERITKILSDEIMFNQILKDKFVEVSNKFGDERRTQILDIATEDNDNEPVEVKNLLVNLTNFGNLYSNESITLVTQKRGGAGSKLKLQSGEVVTETLSSDNTSFVMAFSSKGKSYGFNLSELPTCGRVNVNDFFNLESGEVITNIVSYDKPNRKNYIVFITKMGMVKKSNLDEYKVKKRGVQALKIKEDDALVSTLFVNKENIAITTKNGQIVFLETESINPIGRIAMGVKGVKLNDGDFICDARIIQDNDKEIISISKAGLVSRTMIDCFSITGRNTKGVKLQKLGDDDELCGFVPISDEKEIMVISTSASIQIPLTDIATTGRGAQGVKSMKLKPNEKITRILAKSEV